MSDFGFLANPPVRQAWLDGHPAYEADSAALVRAYLRLLKSAVRSAVPGAINASSSVIAVACGLSEDDVVRHWDVLTHGWELREDGFLHHDGVAQFCAELSAQYGMQMAELRERIAAADLAAQAVASGVSVKPAAKKARGGKRPLPEDFGLTPELVDWLSQERGITEPYHHKFLMDGFIAFAKSKAPAYSDWSAAFRNNVDFVMRTSRQLPPPPTERPGVAYGLGKRPTFGAPQVDRQRALRSSVEDVFDRAHGRDAERGGVHG